MKRLYLLTFVIVFALSSCVDKLDLSSVSGDVALQTALVVPLGHTHATVFDIFAQIDDDKWRSDTAANFVYLFIEEKLEMTDFKGKIVDLDGETNSFAVPASTYTGPFNFGYTKYEDGVLVQRVDEIVIKKAKLEIEATGTAPAAGTNVTVAFPGTTTKTFSGAFSGAKAELEITDAKFMIGGVGNNSTVNVSITTNPAAALALEVKMTGVEIDTVWGYFNRRDRVTHDNITADIPTDLFGNSEILNNNLLFHNPLIEFSIQSNIGVPLKFIVDSIKAVDKNGYYPDIPGGEVWADFNGQKWAALLLETPTNVGDVELTNEYFDREHGATNRLFLIKPEYFKYDFHVEIDSLKADSKKNETKPHFLVAPLKLDMDVSARLRFWFDENTIYSRNDTLEIDLQTITIGKSIKVEPEKFSIRFDFKNHLPLQVTAKAIFVDENNHEVFRRENIIIESPDVDNEGYVLNEKSFLLSIPFEGEDAENLRKSKKIILEYYGAAKDYNITTNKSTKQINVKGSDYLDVFISLFAEGKLTTNIDSIK
jgi:hypothetical protein